MAKSHSISTVETLQGPGQSVAAGVYICVHGHFYQPPREHPFLEVIDRQPSAAPFHDWNERILHESYRPNAFARVLNDSGQLVRIVNNYEYISFNIGPTLMSWLERHDLETYQRILEADQRSCDRTGGHGNAIAQVYNHIILPLANRRDKVTQVRWGIADFCKRFGRKPEGMWLAETAVDQETLEVLVNEGIRFIVLAPSQAAKCRRFGLPEGFDAWQTVEQGEIDPTRPYRCFVPPQPNGCNYLDIFFYDGPISGDIGFDDLLSSSQQFAQRLELAVRPWANRQGDHRWHEPEGVAEAAQLISVATDGETFGHHRSGAEKALAYALTYEFPARGWQVTNYAHYLSLCPPTWEVQLKPVTAWSCSHGVDRWHQDCGCGGGGGWHQQWRAPLRSALDWLRDRLGKLYEEVGASLLKDPWEARNDYIAVMSDRAAHTLENFLATHQTHELSAGERIRAVQLLEMQRQALLMYTSCGWFFDEISRPEGTQLLRYAARAMELAAGISGVDLEPAFIGQLETAPSNLDHFANGAGVYLKKVKAQQMGIEQVVAHYAMGSLFDLYRSQQALYCYTLERQDYFQLPMGALTLAIGQVQMTSDITQESAVLAFAVVHLGGWDFHCGVQAFPSWATYAKAKAAVIEAFTGDGIARSVLAISQFFGATYTLQNLRIEERQQIMQQLNRETLQRLDGLYEQVYRENYGLLMAFHRDRIPVPQALQVAVDITLSQKALGVLAALEQEIAEPEGNLLQITVGRIAELEGIATEAHHFAAQLKLPGSQTILERLIYQGLNQTLVGATTGATPEVTGEGAGEPSDLKASDLKASDLKTSVEGLGRLIHLGSKLGLSLDLSRAQERYYDYLLQVRQCPEAAAAFQSAERWDAMAQLGQALAVDVPAIWIS